MHFREKREREREREGDKNFHTWELERPIRNSHFGNPSISPTLQKKFNDFTDILTLDDRNSHY